MKPVMYELDESSTAFSAIDCPNRGYTHTAGENACQTCYRVLNNVFTKHSHTPLDANVAFFSYGVPVTQIWGYESSEGFRSRRCHLPKLLPSFPGYDTNAALYTHF